VSTSLLEKVKLDIQEFFKLPIEEKKKYWQTRRLRGVWAGLCCF